MEPRETIFERFGRHASILFKRESPLLLELRDVMKTLFASSANILGIIIIVFMLIVAIFAPLLAPYEYQRMAVSEKLVGPSLTHLFGTDQFGRDVLSRTIYGARVSLMVGLGGTAVALLIGALFGAIAGYWGGWWDEVLMRFIDIWMAFPYIVLAIVLAWAIGPGVRNLILVIGIIEAPIFARITRGSVIVIKNMEYVTAAKCIGQNDLIVLARHILPNCISPIIVYSSLTVATAILTEAALSFLGLGIQPPVPSWGTMLADGRRYMLDAPWMPTIPGIVISIAILGYNLLGDGLRDILDPRIRRQMH
jgi:peptide/nickel transport system permease protein